MIGLRRVPASEAGRRVGVRMRRQKLLTAADPPRVWSILDEAALRQPVGGPAVMREQLRRLTEVAALPDVTLQIVPFHGCPGRRGRLVHRPALRRA